MRSAQISPASSARSPLLHPRDALLYNESGTLSVTFTLNEDQLALRHRSHLESSSVPVITEVQSGSVKVTPASSPVAPPVLVLRSHVSVTCMTFSPDGSSILSGGEDSTAWLWDVNTGKELLAFRNGPTNTTCISAIAFSADGRLIASADAGGIIVIWNAKSGIKSLGPLKGHTSYIFSVVFSPDGCYVASGSMDETIIVWDVRTGMAKCILREHVGDVLCVAFSADGKRVVSGGRDKTIRMWDVLSGRAIGEPLQKHNDFIVFVSFSPDYTKIVSGDRTCRFCVWDATTGALLLIPSITYSKGSLAVAFQPTSRHMAVSPDGRWLAKPGWLANGTTSAQDEICEFVDLETGYRSRFVGRGGGSGGTVWGVAWGFGGRRVASACDDGTIRVCDWLVGS